MKHARTLPVLIALALIALMAGAAARAEAPQADRADAEKWVRFYGHLVDTMLADQNDCAKMASDINAEVDANQALIKKAKDPANANKKLPPDLQKQVDADSKRLGTAIQKCIRDPKVGAALERLDARHHLPK